MFGLQVYAGDVAPIPAMTLTDQAGNAVNLSPLVSLTFRMVDARDGTVMVNNLPATKVQSDGDQTTWGQVAYQWRPIDTASPGLYRAFFIFDGGGGTTRYPIADDFYVLIKPAI